MRGLVLDPWRFDPVEGALAANEVIRAGSGALSLLQERISEATDLEEAVAAVIAARIAVAPTPVFGRADTFRPDGSVLPHHPFVLSRDLPFLPVGAFEGGGASVAPATQVELCFRDGSIQTSPFNPGDPIRAAVDLIDSPTWRDLILPSARGIASRMVRWQAARGKRRADPLTRLEPSTADDDEFERWWQTIVRT